MRIKKFTGKSFQDAFDQVKKNLGANAVILNSRKIKEGGILDFMNSKEMYEVTAAVDEEKSAKEQESIPLKARQAYQIPGKVEGKNNGNGTNGWNGNGNGNGSVAQQAPDTRMLKQHSHDIKLLHEEIQDLKKSLTQVSDFLKYSKMPALPDIFKQILKKLMHNDVNEDLAKAFVQTVYSKTNASDYKNKTTVVNNLLILMKRMIKIAPSLEKAKRSPYVVAMVGPTGVGKTTTVAKLAANLKLYGQKKVALISADTYRIAAIEQLQTFANIASIPMSVVYSPEDMQGALKKFRDKDIVLIDTVGRSQKNKDHLKNLNNFIEMAKPDETHLVLSLTTGFRNLLDIIQRFQVMRPNRFVFTKLDEALNTGNILNILYKHQLPVSYITTGQVVPNDITEAEKNTLVNLIFKGVLN